ncbi:MULTISPECIES: M13 family metallopeptidase [Aerococcus]|uniref:M13 family peptidase n=1 Tax=Aerococcus tenax TaxID=3078812 RepID=A0A5N1BNI6_9LACT|nr:MULTISPECIES: M13-type metalloendopeptidase [Aerococcus]KAA9239213.1 M13 family peptidase [Aerococcus urinae]MDK7801730.1 M13-type metalloendopeptidase [Aerococcus urinae]MDK8655317.1 M13-type metalloendopeptidase [Aerococcus urinae]MDL5178754.1 M13-type metalloendopeptidase [Aerococcus tenax]
MTVDMSQAKEDLYMAVNGEWIDQAEIPEDKSSTGGFMALRDGIEELSMAGIEKMAAGEIKLDNPEMEEMITLYQLAMDFDRLDQEGANPIQADLENVDELTDFSQIQAFSKQWLLAGHDFVFNLGNEADMKNTVNYALYLSRPNTILPDKGYYEEDNGTGKQLLEIWRRSTVDLLKAMGFSDELSQRHTDQAIAFDALFVPYVKSQEELADYTKSYNPKGIDEVESYTSHFSLKAIIKELIGQEPETVIVTEPRYFEALDEFFSPHHFEELKSWMIVNVARDGAQALSEDLRQIASQYSLALSGNPKTMSREKHAFYLTVNTFDQVFGCYYGKKYFGPEARADVTAMIEEMIAVYKDRLKHNTWLSQQTIKKAIVKLDAITIMAGYPDSYPEIYQRFKVDSNLPLYQNLKAFTAERVKDNLAKWGQEVDHSRWHMSAETVNAYYDPSANNICFPAGILQAPFYDLKQSRSENYGGIGGVIAHEISHAFDNNGAQFDEQGNLNNWWLDEDYEVFTQKAQAMIDQFDGLPLGDGEVNGTLTVSENIADAGGLQAAYQAMTHEEDYDPIAFFNNWARIWCMKARPQYQNLLLSIDVHAPNYWRANQQVKNLDAFHVAYQTSSENKMYLDPEDRVVIW